MDHRSRPRSIGLSRIPGAQSRATRIPIPLHVEQEAREGEEWERELPRQRPPPTYIIPESEELQESVMGKVLLSFPEYNGVGFILGPQKAGAGKRKAENVVGRSRVSIVGKGQIFYLPRRLITRIKDITYENNSKVTEASWNICNHFREAESLSLSTQLFQACAVSLPPTPKSQW